MKDKQITVTQEELETIVYDEVLRERHMLFDLCLEDYNALPVFKELKGTISMSCTEWDKHLDQFSQTLGDLAIARELIATMKPVFSEYWEEYEKRHQFNIDGYMKMITTTYGAEEFERVRDKFEEDYYKGFNDDELEH